MDPNDQLRLHEQYKANRKRLLINKAEFLDLATVEMIERDRAKVDIEFNGQAYTVSMTRTSQEEIENTKDEAELAKAAEGWVGDDALKEAALDHMWQAGIVHGFWCAKKKDDSNELD